MTDESTKSTPEVQAAVTDALQAITERSFSGRHPELGKMINCKFCGLRHRENERKCKQHFSTVVDRGPNERVVPERRAPETRKGILGAAMFAKRRIRPHKHPKQPMHHWLKVIMETRKKRDEEDGQSVSSGID